MLAELEARHAQEMAEESERVQQIIEKVLSGELSPEEMQELLASEKARGTRDLAAGVQTPVGGMEGLAVSPVGSAAAV